MIAGPSDDKVCMLAGTDKTDFLTIALVGGEQAKLGRLASNFRFFKFANGSIMRGNSDLSMPNKT